MLRTTKNMKEKYEKIQNFLFILIPEKWESIYLYASVSEQKRSKISGELFFYYLPKGILKKKPINVYEVPKRFNINEEQYLQIVAELYKCIKSLKQDFVDTEQELWTNLTISISNFKFRVEYYYNELPITSKEVEIRNIIWKYKYLNIGGENKEERKILDEYFSNEKPNKRELYETGIYLKTDNNSVTFDKENDESRKFILYEKDDIEKIIGKTKNIIHSNNTTNMNKDFKYKNEKSNKNEKKNSEIKENHSRNQIFG